jgi:hypothetical protein
MWDNVPVIFANKRKFESEYNRPNKDGSHKKIFYAAMSKATEYPYMCTKLFCNQSSWSSFHFSI